MYNAFISYSHAADGRLAPALQLALEKFAKPWYKVRNLDVFRDEASLSVTPHLWGNIQQALDQSEYLIYMASPVSAASKWVTKEIEYWLEHKPLEKLLIVLTDGSLLWDDTANTFLDPANNSLPDVLDKKFLEEPFYIDLRSLKTEEDLSLNNSIFKKEVLKLAAQLHGKVPKDMASDEVLAHQKMMRVRNAAIGLLTVLLVTALGAAVIANKNANEAKKQTQIARDSSIVAQQQRGIAFHQTKIAEDSAKEAQLQRDNAYRQQQIAVEERNNAVVQKQIAVKEKNIAQANFLISEAQREGDPTLALLYGQEALKIHSAKGIYSKAYRIYRYNNFYKTIISNQNIRQPDSIAFLPDDNLFITYGMIDDLVTQFEIDIPRPSYFKQGKKVFAIGTKYRVWNLSGELLDELSAAQVRAKYGFPFNEKSKDIYLNYDAVTIGVYTKAGELVKAFQPEIKGIRINRAFLSPDNRKVISVWNDGRIRVWDITSGLMFDFKTNGYDGITDREELVAISDDGEKMISASDDGIIKLWDLQNKGLVNSVIYSGGFDCAAFSQDNQTIMLLTSNEIKQWDTRKNTITAIKKNYPPCQLNNDKALYKIGGDFEQLVFKKDTKDNELIVAGAPQGIDYFGVMPGNKKIVTVSGDTMMVWSIQAAYPPSSRNRDPFMKMAMDDPATGINDIAFSTDGKRMLVMSFGDDAESIVRKISLWDIDKGECMRVFPAFENTGFEDKTFMCFSPDNKKIFIACGQLLTVWNCPEFLDAYFKQGRVRTLREEKNAAMRVLIRD